MAKTIPSTVSELIAWGKSQEISYRNLHRDAYVVNKDTSETIRIPLTDIISEYKYFLQPYIIEFTMHDEELQLYQFNPKALSNKLYGTTEYWAVLLMINNCISKIDFSSHKIKVLDPKRVRGFVNEVLILEKILR